MKNRDAGYIVIVLLAALPLALLKGLAISLLWGWFLVPLGVMPIGVVHGIGIASLCMLIAPTDERSDEHDPDEALIKALSKAVTRPLAALIIGFLVHLAM